MIKSECMGCLISSIHNLREQAWLNSIKYKYDPVVGRAHEKYLADLNMIIDEYNRSESDRLTEYFPNMNKNPFKPGKMNHEL